jgi:hypothetical protein
LTFLISLEFRSGELSGGLIRRSSWLRGLFPDQFGKPIRRFIKANAQPVAFAQRDLTGIRGGGRMAELSALAQSSLLALRP